MDGFLKINDKDEAVKHILSLCTDCTLALMTCDLHYKTAMRMAREQLELCGFWSKLAQSYYGKAGTWEEAFFEIAEHFKGNEK